MEQHQGGVMGGACGGVANSPIAIDFLGGHGSGDGSHEGAQNAGHAVQVVNATCVLNLQLVLQDWLRGGQEAGNEMVFLRSSQDKGEQGITVHILSCWFADEIRNI